MPPKHPVYPYVEPIAANMSDAEIEQVVQDLSAQNPKLKKPDGGALDPLCRSLNVDLEYSDDPHEILLDVPKDRKAVIWLPKNGKPRQDRLETAIGVGHWLLHVPITRDAHPACGIQALQKPADDNARAEALRFALILLMPAEIFGNLWYEGRAKLVADTLMVPTSTVYARAEMLDLSVSTDEGDKYQWKERGHSSRY